MNYYAHHIGDYAAATGHLSWDEDMAYTRLLRAYYLHERGIPEGQQYRLARASTPAQRKAVDTVLAEFFSLVEGEHRQKRADDEIARFQDKQRKAKASAEHRWSARDSQSERNANASPNAMRTHTEGNAPNSHNQEPIENPPTPRKRGSVHEFPPGFDSFWSAYPRKTAKPQAAKAFARLKPDEALLRTLLAAIERQRHWPQWTKDGGEFIPHPATWLNGQRWLDRQPGGPAPGNDDIFAGAR